MPKARKTHTCMLCGFVIEKGSDYHYHRYAPWESEDHAGSWWTLRTHQRCYEILLRDYLEYGFFDMPDIGEFRYESLGEGKLLSEEEMRKIVNQAPEVAEVVSVNPEKSC
jgi:hypothetical protein